MSKVAILGLDSASPDLVFDRFRDELPNLARLIDGGAYGRLRSTHPPITVPAWTSMTTGLDPGELGLYGFRNRKDHSYDGYQFATSTLVTRPRLWDLVGESGKRSIVLGVPQTYPTRPLRGEMVSCFLTPSNKSQYTQPPELKEEVERVTGGYTFDVANFRTTDKVALLERCYEKTEKHLRLVKHMLGSREWDFFMMVEMGMDRIHHGFWSFMDPLHHRYEAGNPLEGAIFDYYRHVDAEIGEILALMPEDTSVLVVSDHGARRMEGGICFNEWLIDKGYLVLKERPKAPAPLVGTAIDWSRTRAWGDGGYYGRCFLNVKGREPNGVIDPSDYESVRSQLIEEIAAIEDPEGKCIGSRACRPEDLYDKANGVAPDLLVYFGDLSWRSVGSVGMGSIHTFENDTGPDEANHDWHGIVVAARADATAIPGLRGDMGEVSIYDIAPTVLDIMGIEIPDHMIGRPLG